MSITNDYGSYSSFGGVASAGAGFLGAFVVIYVIMMLLALAASVIMIISEWKIFEKNNKPGWYSLIPFLKMWTLFEIVGVQGWWCLVPFANVVFTYIVSYKLAIKYGKSTGFAVITLLFPFVGYPMIAFAKDETESKKEAKQAEEKKSTSKAKEEKVASKDDKEEKTETNKTTKKATKKNVKFCAKCGAEMEKDAAFCPECGTKA